MTKEEKELLLKVLCAGLLYGVKILHEGWSYEWDQEISLVERVVGIDEKFIYTKVIDSHNGEEYRDDTHLIDTFNDKPYLRPMSSMTEEEENELVTICVRGGYKDSVFKSYLVDDWLNAHHFDFRRLISMGLALEAPKDMYKNK